MAQDNQESRVVQERLLYLLYPLVLLLLMLVVLAPLVHQLRYERLLLLGCMAVSLLHVGVWLSRSARGALALVLVDSAAVVVMAALLSRRVMVYDYDTWTHVALAIRVGRHGLFPGDMHFAGEATPPFFSLLHVVLAALHRGTGIEVIDLFAAGSVVGTGLRILALLLLAAAWFRRADLLLLVVLAAGAGLVWRLHTQGYPWRLGSTLLLFALWARSELDTRRRQEDVPRGSLRNWAVAVACLYGASIATHLFAGVVCTVILVGYEVVLWLREPPLRALGWRQQAARLWYLPLGLLIGAPWILNTLTQMLAAEGISELFVSGVEFPRLFGLWSVADWAGIYWRLPRILLVLPLAGLLLAIPALRRRLRSVRLTPISQAGGRLLWLCAGGSLLVLTTPLFGLACRLFSPYYPPRLAQLVLVPLLVALAFAPLLRLPLEVGERSPRHHLHTALFGLVLGTFCMLTLLYTAREYRQQWRVTDNFPILSPAFQEQWRALAAEHQPSVVLSDPKSSFLAPALLDAQTVAVPADRVNPYLDPRPRLTAVATVLDPASSDAAVAAVFDRYRVSHVLLHLAPAFAAAPFEPVTRHYPPGIRERLLAHPRLELVYEDAHLLLLRVLPPGDS